jgi:hypothetical protein
VPPADVCCQSVKCAASNSDVKLVVNVNFLVLAKRSRDESSPSSRNSVLLPDFLTAVSVHFRDSVPQDVVKSLSRHIIAYPFFVGRNLTAGILYAVVHR